MGCIGTEVVVVRIALPPVVGSEDKPIPSALRHQLGLPYAVSDNGQVQFTILERCRGDERGTRSSFNTANKAPWEREGSSRILESGLRTREQSPRDWRYLLLQGSPRTKPDYLGGHDVMSGGLSAGTETGHDVRGGYDVIGGRLFPPGSDQSRGVTLGSNGRHQRARAWAAWAARLDQWEPGEWAEPGGNHWLASRPRGNDRKVTLPPVVTDQKVKPLSGKIDPSDSVVNVRRRRQYGQEGSLRGDEAWPVNPPDISLDGTALWPVNPRAIIPPGAEAWPGNPRAISPPSAEAWPGNPRAISQPSAEAWPGNPRAISPPGAEAWPEKSRGTIPLEGKAGPAKPRQKRQSAEYRLMTEIREHLMDRERKIRLHLLLRKLSQLYGIIY
ncbi:hypothetical protein Bbelb_096190 [Branchiostoma belcheri]|nr:hypothetical protein Bbelb_096190 [Branchiostoma belcheri]